MAKERLNRPAPAVKNAEERGEFIQGPDGFTVYWPCERHGALRASDLRALAAELDKRNRAWGAQLTEASKRGEI